jgi:hypothetical protein
MEPTSENPPQQDQDDLEHLLQATQFTSSNKIDNQISTLRKQLEESHSMLVNTREILTNISITGVMDKVKQSESIQNLYSCQQAEDALQGKNVDEIFANTTNFVEKRQLNMTEIADSVPEIKQLFRTLQDLKQKMMEMEANHKLLADLNDDIECAIEEMNVRNGKIKDYCENHCGRTNDVSE